MLLKIVFFCIIGTLFDNHLTAVNAGWSYEVTCLKPPAFMMDTPKHINKDFEIVERYHPKYMEQILKSKEVYPGKP
ncbi:hypothetical protein GJ496_011209 [Pomphorhynchus laevis]|nr:hypothetical protein GJ496_011209 [Pomphorhynchus laevis]